MVTIHADEDTEYVGLLHSHTGQVIGDISRNYSVTFSAFVPDKKSLPTPTAPKSRRLCILLYGFQRDSETIGQALSENNIYLQHPPSYDPSVVYSNPHYLARPGSAPSFTQTTSRVLGNSARSSQIHDECVRNEILQALDTADGPQNFSALEASGRLCTTLKTYVFPHKSREFVKFSVEPK
jgi:hypothetical protein